MELEDPVLKRKLKHEYAIKVLPDRGMRKQSSLRCCWAHASPAAAQPQAADGVHRRADRGAARQTGAYVLETGAEALLARAWLVDHARSSIEVQYFIWSTDNIGILASEALLRAAQARRAPCACSSTIC